MSDDSPTPIRFAHAQTEDNQSSDNFNNTLKFAKTPINKPAASPLPKASDQRRHTDQKIGLGSARPNSGPAYSNSTYTDNSKPKMTAEDRRLLENENRLARRLMIEKPEGLKGLTYVLL